MFPLPRVPLASHSLLRVHHVLHDVCPMTITVTAVNEMLHGHCLVLAGCGIPSLSLSLRPVILGANMECRLPGIVTLGR